MAEGKKSIILYTDILYTVKALEDGEAGRLFKHLLMYVNDEDPVCDDRIVLIAFEPIKQQLKRDLKLWESSLETKSLNGRIGNLKRWNPDLYNQYIAKKITLEEAEIIANGRTVSHSDKKETVAINNIANIAVNDNVTVNVNDNVINKKKEGDKSPVPSKVETELIFPFESESFKKSWDILVRQKKWKSKSSDALQAALNKLGKQSELDAIEMINNAVAGGWQGLFELEKNKGPSQKKSKIEQTISVFQKVINDQTGNGDS